MNKNNFYTIKSTLELKFKTSKLCDISYNSFLPEFNIVKSRRSAITMKKKEYSLIFQIDSNDITAFRASINEIISFGKVIDSTLKIVENS